MFLQLLVHLAGVANYTYGIYFQMLVVDIPVSLSKTRHLFGGPWKFLTFWNLWLQLAFHLVGLLNCLFGSSSVTSDVDKRSKLQRTRDFLFASLAFPIGVFTGAVFWALFLIDRELVFPARFDPFIPPFENHVLHTSVLVLQLLELTLTPHAYPARGAGMAVTAAACAAYHSWICAIAYFGGFWVYPVFKVLSPPLRVVFIAACSLGGCFLYLIGEKLTELVWGKHIVRASKLRVD